LDKLYVCNECKACHLFKSDVAAHQEMTGHNTGFTEMPINAFAK
jgi:hypothetical protein